MRKIFLTLALAAMAVTAEAQKKCGQEDNTIVFTPQWTAQAQFAGYYVAEAKGFYDEAGLNVHIEHPTATRSNSSRLRNGECQATTFSLCQAMELIDNNFPVVNILQTSMNTGLVIISSRGKDPLTQRGARVGIWKVGFSQLALCMNQKEGLNYEWVRFAQNVNLFIAGALDATLAMSYNEYYQILQAGIELDEGAVYRFCDHGYNVQEDGLYMSRSYYEQHPDMARRFAEASRRGWEWAAAHPDETLDIVMQYVARGNLVTNRVMQKLMLKEVLRLQVDRETKRRDFRLRQDMVELASRLMAEYGLLKREVRYEELVNGEW